MKERVKTLSIIILVCIIMLGPTAIISYSFSGMNLYELNDSSKGGAVFLWAMLSVMGIIVMVVDTDNDK